MSDSSSDKSFKDYIQRMTAESTRLHAEVAHWKAAQEKTQASAYKALTEMHKLLENFADKTIKLLRKHEQSDACCKDCDINAIRAQVEEWRPAKLLSPVSSEHARS